MLGQVFGQDAGQALGQDFCQFVGQVFRHVFGQDFGRAEQQRQQLRGKQQKGARVSRAPPFFLFF